MLTISNQALIKGCEKLKPLSVFAEHWQCKNINKILNIEISMGFKTYPHGINRKPVQIVPSDLAIAVKKLKNHIKIGDIYEINFW